MTAKVGQKQPILAQPPAALAPVRQPAPGGVGEAPTTITGRDPMPVGYAEMAVLAVKNFIVWLFSKIFCCFMKAEPVPLLPVVVPVAPPPAVVAAPPVQVVVTPPPPAPRLNPRVQQDIDLLDEFDRLDEEEKNRVYIKIGQDRHLYYFRIGDDLTAGKNKVLQDPQILLKYIIRP